MKLGIHAYQWTSEWSNDTLWIIDNVRKLGLDFIEIPLMLLDKFDPVAVREKLDGFPVTTSTVILNEDQDITSFDADVRRNGTDMLKKCVEVSAGAGARMFSGVLYSLFDKRPKAGPTEQEWEFSADALREVAKYAGDLGLSIAVEPVSRFNTYLVNTSGQALKLIDMIGEPNVFVHLDSYHMNIEEKNFHDAVVTAGDRMSNFHMVENDRGVPGTGLVDWDGIFRAFKETGFDGYLGFEGFSGQTENMSTLIWRDLAPGISLDEYVQLSIDFARELLKKYDLA